MPDDIRWIRSYVLSEPANGGVGTVCIYQASSPEAIRRHADGRRPACGTRSSRWPTRWSCGPIRCRRAPEPVTRRNTMSGQSFRTLAVLLPGQIVVLAHAPRRGAASAHAAGTGLDQVRHATAPYRQLKRREGGRVRPAEGRGRGSTASASPAWARWASTTSTAIWSAMTPVERTDTRRRWSISPIHRGPSTAAGRGRVRGLQGRRGPRRTPGGRTLFGPDVPCSSPAGNRFGLPAFYSLHAWIWKHNPAGMFEMWNPNVTCPAA